MADDLQQGETSITVDLRNWAFGRVLPGDQTTALNMVARAADRIAELEAEVERVSEALQEARPVVANAAADPDAAPWQRETRQGILERVDAALSEKGDKDAT